VKAELGRGSRSQGAGAARRRGFADDAGVEPLSHAQARPIARRRAEALYKHVANKDELLDGMIDVVVGEIDPSMAISTGRRRFARESSRLAAHSCGIRGLQSDGVADPPTPTILAYMDSMIGDVRAGGFRWI